MMTTILIALLAFAAGLGCGAWIVALRWRRWLRLTIEQIESERSDWDTWRQALISGQ